MEPTQQPNGFNQPGQTFSPQRQAPGPGQIPGDGVAQPTPPPEDAVDVQQAQRMGQQLAAAQQQFRGAAAGTGEEAMLNKVFEQLANEPATGSPPETETQADEGELIIRPQQPNGNGNWNGDNNGNSN